MGVVQMQQPKEAWSRVHYLLDIWPALQMGPAVCCGLLFLAWHLTERFSACCLCLCSLDITVSWPL